MEQSGITLSQPKVFCRKPVQVNSELFKNVFNVVKDLALQNYTSLPKDFVDLFTGIKFQDDPAEKGWILVNRALRNAMVALALESRELKTEDELVFDDLDKQVAEVFGSDSIVIEPDFFKYPKKLAVIEKIKPIYNEFLALCGLEETQARNIANRLPSYFVLALTEEWRKNVQEYKIILDALNSPLNEAESKELGWIHYSAWLQKQIDEPMFDESFSLSQVYVPLRAYYKEKIQERGRLVDVDREESQDKVKRVVVDLEKALDNWVNRADKGDALRIISGGPGYGKSSFLKMFAAHQIEKGRIKVLFIPLHRFEVKEDLKDAIRNFVQYDSYLKHNLFDEERLLVIFDGLDELAMQGKALADVANQFVVEVKRKLDLFNQQNLRLLVLLSGRDIIIQSNENEFRKLKQILHILPYYVENNDAYEDTDNLLKEDQRDRWWSNYGIIKGKPYMGLPENLQGKDLEEITKQPLLNYLVALSVERKVLNFTDETTLNEVYDDLLVAVYERNYANGTLKALNKIEYVDYLRVLQEIAVSAWHDDGRTTTVAKIEKQCSDSGISAKLKEFISGMNKGVISLLTSFYFRKSGVNQRGDDTFEFTHKSFGEFLTAKRIVAKVKQIEKNLTHNRNDSECGLDVKRCLEEWIKMFGFKEIDEDLFRFILTEMKREYLVDKSYVERLQDTLVELFNFMLLNGMPAEKLEEGSTYFRANKLAITAEKALLILISSVAFNTKRVSSVVWPSKFSCGDFISRVMGQRKDQIEFILKHLNYLNMEDCILTFRDLSWAVLSGANLSGASLLWADLRGADLRGADLSGAIISEANLREANLREANLSWANLSGADLRGTNLNWANLSKADLRWANLSEADLSRADLNRANLRWANLRWANLSEIDLSEVDLADVDLSVARNVPKKYLKQSKKKTT